MPTSLENIYSSITNKNKSRRNQNVSPASSTSAPSTVFSGHTSPQAPETTSQQKSSKRRPHSKSRHGCSSCKRRRVKCDETHPICKNCKHLDLECSFSGTTLSATTGSSIVNQGKHDIMNIRLFHHYTTVVCKTIVQAGISNEEIWCKDVPEMAFEYPYLMHSILTFSATHISRTKLKSASSIDQVITFHRADALRLLSEAVRNVTDLNLDALVASSILLILDSLANASSDSSSPSSLPPSAWLHHVRGAATILTAVGQPSKASRFYRLINIDLVDLAGGLMNEPPVMDILSPLECFDDDLQELYPVSISSPYYNALAYLDKLFRQRYKSDFILRVFSFPALLDRGLLSMLIQGDNWAKRIVRVYYRLVKSFTSEMKETVWFLEGVGKVLPIDMDSELGGLGFITQALPVQSPESDSFAQKCGNIKTSDNVNDIDLMPTDIFGHNSGIESPSISFNNPQSTSKSVPSMVDSKNGITSLLMLQSNDSSTTTINNFGTSPEAVLSNSDLHDPYITDIIDLQDDTNENSITIFNNRNSYSSGIDSITSNDDIYEDENMTNDNDIMSMIRDSFTISANSSP